MYICICVHTHILMMCSCPLPKETCTRPFVEALFVKGKNYKKNLNVHQFGNGHRDLGINWNMNDLDVHVSHWITLRNLQLSEKKQVIEK